jgi:phosphomannomutase
MAEITDLTQKIKRGRIRAIANKEITPEFAAKLGAAHGTFLGSKGILVIGREYNNNNRMIKRAYISGVMSSGVDILNLHSAPVPVLQFCIRRFGASGGVYMSSGSSLEGEISIRIFDSSGVEYNAKNIESINEYFKNAKINRANPSEVGSISDIPHTQDIYKKALPQFINRKLFQQKKLHAVIDCSYGPTSVTIPSILSDLKIDVIAINSYESDRKSAEVFPNLRSIKNCVNIVKAASADLGVILDADGSRAVFVDETGYLLTYEELMMFFMSYEENIKKSKGNTIVTSDSSSRVLEQYTEQQGYKLLKSSNYPGEISRTIREERALFGGADTYKYYFPQYGPFSDATFTTLKILEVLASQNAPLSSLIRTFPRTIHAYKTLQVKSDVINSLTLDLKRLLRENKDPSLDYQDILLGMKIYLKEQGWVIIMPSLHSNSIELTAEGNDSSKAEELIKYAENLLAPLLK